MSEKIQIKQCALPVDATWIPGSEADVVNSRSALTGHHLDSISRYKFFLFCHVNAYLADAGDLLLGEAEARQGAVSGWRAVGRRGSRPGCAVTHPGRQHCPTTLNTSSRTNFHTPKKTPSPIYHQDHTSDSLIPPRKRRPVRELGSRTPGRCPRPRTLTSSRSATKLQRQLDCPHKKASVFRKDSRAWLWIRGSGGRSQWSGPMGSRFSARCVRGRRSNLIGPVIN